jgi:membrane family protein
MLTGTIVNVLAILVGSAVGLLIKWLGTRFSTLFAGATNTGLRLQAIITQGAALCVMYLGISGCLEGEHSLISILSMVLGCLIGELLDLDRRMQTLGNWVQERTKRVFHEGGTATIAEGFLTASLLFCVGAMAIVGALNDGLTGNHDMLFAKAMLDGIISIVFASSLGIGVAFSAVAVFLYQGSISLLAAFLAPLLQNDTVIGEMTCVGSLLIIALSLNMLNITKIKVMNMVPAIFFPILLCQFL